MAIITPSNILVMAYFDRINEVLDVACPVMMLRTHETERAYRGIKNWCKEADAVLYKWNCVEGMLEMSLSFDTVLSVEERASDVVQVLVEIERRQDNPELEVFVIEGIYDFVFRADVKILLRKLIIDLPKSGGKKRVVLLNPIPDLPQELAPSIPVLELALPDQAELMRLLESQLKAARAKAEDTVKASMVVAAEGMTIEAADLAFKIAGIRTEFGDEAAAVVRECRQYYLEAKSPN
jgi:uncharacterized pyridoxamine 5'-phosphate oxidase family protein